MTLRLAAWYRQDPAEPGLAKRLTHETGLTMRRHSLLSRLALAGALGCHAQAALHPDTAVLACSRHGANAECLSAMDQVIGEGQPPMPFTFINTQHNQATLALNQALGLRRPALFVNGGAAPFTAPLWLAAQILTSAPAVLVGYVDEPHDRDGLPGESGWLYLAPGDGPGPGPVLSCEIADGDPDGPGGPPTVPATLWDWLAGAAPRLALSEKLAPGRCIRLELAR